MKIQWPFRSRANRAEESDEVDERDDVPGARDDGGDGDLLSEDERPPKARSRKRVAFLIAGLGLVVAVAAWSWWPSSPVVRSGPTSDPLLAVRPIAPPGQPPTESPPTPEGQAPAPSELPPRREEPAAPARPTYYTPLPPRPEPPAVSPAGPPQQLAAMGWELATKDREARLAGLEATTKELQAKTREAEARIAEADAWIQAMKQDPRLALRSRDKGLSGGTGRVSGPPLFEVPPPPPGFPQGSGSLVVPPKAGGAPPIQPERTPKDSEIFVRMIDGSGIPEAMVSVGPASYMVRAGDTIGAWEVTAIGPNGIWIKAGPNERAWRPLLASGSRRSDLSSPSPGVPAAPAQVAPPTGAPGSK